MALLFMDGFDKYGAANSNSTSVIALLTAGEWTTATAANAIVAPLSATGFALQINGAGGVVSKTLGANYPRLIGGVRFSSNLGTTAGISFLDGVTVQASITFNTPGTFSVRNGIYNTGTILGTSTASVTANTTHYLEWDFTFANAGSYQLWLDGVSILSGSGDTTTTANNYANVFQFNVASSSVTLIIDDLYLLDATGTTNNAPLLTSPRIETQFPNADGAVQFAVGAAILGNSIQRAAGSVSATANDFRVKPVRPGVSGTLTSITITGGGLGWGANQVRPIVYADNGSGVPGALLMSGAAAVGPAASTTVTYPLTSGAALTGGTQYFIGFMASAAVTNGLLSTGTAEDRVGTATFASGAPATAPSVGAAVTGAQYYGTLTVPSGNWYEVSQNPSQGSLSYVYDATVGHEDLYAFPVLSAPPSAIYAVAVKASLAKSDAGAKTASVRLKSGSTDSAGSGGTALAPGTSFGWMTSHYERDPNGSIAWTKTALDAAQAGVKVET